MWISYIYAPIPIYFSTTKILHQGLNENFKAGKNKTLLQD